MTQINQLIREYKKINEPCSKKKSKLYTELDKFHKEDLIKSIILQAKKIIESSKNLITAIDANTEEVQDDIREDDTEIIIKQRFIADELEDLREVLK